MDMVRAGWPVLGISRLELTGPDGLLWNFWGPFRVAMFLGLTTLRHNSSEFFFSLWNGAGDNFSLLHELMIQNGDSVEGLIGNPRNLRIQRRCLEIHFCLTVSSGTPGEEGLFPQKEKKNCL